MSAVGTTPHAHIRRHYGVSRTADRRAAPDGGPGVVAPPRGDPQRPRARPEDAEARVQCPSDPTGRPFAARDGAAAALPWPTHARGLATVLVVMMHGAVGIQAAGLAGVPWPAWLDYLGFTVRMPLFFFVAGLFVRPAMAKGAARYWRRRLTSLALPYGVWLAITLVVLTAASGIARTPAPALSWRLFLWEPLVPFWFLYALLACHAVVWLLRGLPDAVLLPTAIIAYAASQMAGTGMLLAIGWGLPWFVLGSCCAAVLRRPDLPLIDRPWGIVWLAAGAGLCAAEWHALGFDYRSCVPASALGIAASIGLARQLALRDPPGAAVLAAIGRDSLAVLVMHIPVLAALRMVLVRAGLGQPLLILALGTVLGIALPILAGRLFGRVGVAPLLGLPRPGSWKLT